MGLNPGNTTLKMKQGTDWWVYLDIYNIYGDLISIRGATVTAQIKKSALETNAVCIPTVTVLSASSTPQVKLFISKEQSRQMPCYGDNIHEPTKYYFDVKIISNNLESCPIQGIFYLYPEVTKS